MTSTLHPYTGRPALRFQFPTLVDQMNRAYDGLPRTHEAPQWADRRGSYVLTVKSHVSLSLVVVGEASVVTEIDE